MEQKLIFIPFFGLMLLTISIWFYMYYVRLSYLICHKINPQSLASTRQANQVIPDNINIAAENLSNLFELPVLFYTLCLYLFITHNVDNIYLSLAFAFLFIRTIHSVLHCFYNKVIYRFYAHIFSSLVLWAMILLSTFDLFKNITL